MRVLALDYGASRVGLALGDTQSRIPTPWGILDRKDDTQIIRDVLALAKAEGAEAIVVGLPRSLRNPEAFSEQRATIERFVVELRAAAGALEVTTEDETLTSVLGDRLARESGRSGHSDDLAASAILATWLSRKK